MVIVPSPDELSAPYWSGARQRKLMLQSCRACGLRWHPPAPICPACQSADIAWVAASGRGVVYSYTVVHHAVHGAIRDRLPYLVALVELEEGPRVISNIMCPAENVSVGLKVRVTFQELSDGAVLPQFEPAHD